MLRSMWPWSECYPNTASWKVSGRVCTRVKASGPVIIITDVLLFSPSRINEIIKFSLSQIMWAVTLGVPCLTF